MNSTHVADTHRLASNVRALLDGISRLGPSDSSAAFAARVEELVADLERVTDESAGPWFHMLDRDQRLMLMHFAEGGSTKAADTSWTLFNPVAPPLRLEVDGESARGVVRLGPAFSGPPGRVHGGTIATLLDHAMASLLFRLNRPSFTARLEIDYRSGAPLGADLSVKSSIQSVEGRKTWMDASVEFDGVIAARGIGLFLTIHKHDDDLRDGHQLSRQIAHTD